jgi:hypothetical protein
MAHGSAPLDSVKKSPSAKFAACVTHGIRIIGSLASDILLEDMPSGIEHQSINCIQLKDGFGPSTHIPASKDRIIGVTAPNGPKRLSGHSKTDVEVKIARNAGQERRFTQNDP